MKILQRKTVSALALAALASPALVRANVNGADPRLTAAPGESAAACTGCHTGTALNGGSGSVKIVLPGAATYTPGVPQRLKVQVSDATQRRWGFELTARRASSPSTAQAGDLASVDANAQVMCSNGRSKPCADAAVIQFITHTLAGTRNGTTGGVEFQFDWTPPTSDAGNIILYAAGNAANGNNSDSGDRIYTTSVQLSPAAAAPKPVIRSEQGVVNGASFQPGIMQNSWITIKGSDLASVTRTWTAADITEGKLPTALDGVSVSINNKPAYVQYISPTQINAISPADDALGPVEVKVTANGVTSEPVMANLQSFTPAFFAFDGKYLAATHVDGGLLGKSGLFASAPNATTPAKPGEVIVLYGTGFGVTSPATAAGSLTQQIGAITTPLTVTIGGVPATVSFAGLIPGYAQLYQLNVQTPESLADGDQPVVVQMGGVSSTNSAECCFVTVQK